MPGPSSDDLRLRELAEHALLEPRFDPLLDNICRTSSALFGVPMAFVSVIDATHRHLLAHHGVDLGCCPREDTICNLTICGDTPLVIEDALSDPRTRDNPFVVGPPHIRFYVGVPLVLNSGVPLGAFCIADTMPRAMTDDGLSLLVGQTDLIVERFRDRATRQELARRTLELTDRKIALSQAECLAKIGSFEADSATGSMRWSDGLHHIFGTDPNTPTNIETFLSTFLNRGKDLRFALAGMCKDAASLDLNAEFADAAGKKRYVRVHAVSCNHKSGQRIIGVVQDVTDRKLAMAELEWTETHDRLTRLLNRTTMTRRVDASLRAAEATGQSVALIVLDVDRFKTINDTLGHAIGDAVLTVVGGRLRGVIRSQGLVARIGGDEFAVLVEGFENEGVVANLATEIVLALRAPVFIKDLSIDARATLGVALYSLATTCTADLLKEAGIALNHARETGRDGFTFFRPAMLEALEGRVARLALARSAVSARQLEPWFQPKIDLATEEVLGFEALMRWHHPVFGICGPDAMGDVFADTEIATAIGRLMLHRVVADMVKWQRQGLSIGHIAINVAEPEFYASDYAERVLACLSQNDLPAKMLEVEITESVFLGQRSGIVAQTLRKLADAGVSIALDDFGTGYASLTHLKQYPVSSIKIDRSFVVDIESDPGAATIVDAVTSLANSLKIGVVAEGIETEAQLAFLRLRGCKSGQGYLFAKAMPASRVPHFLRTWANKHTEATKAISA